MKMKTLTLALLATFCTLFSFGQNLSDQATFTLNPTSAHTARAFMTSEHAQMASIEQSKYIFMKEYRESSADKCGHAKKMRTVGIILASVGGGLLVTGIALIAIGVQSESNDINNGGDGTTGLPLIAGGAVCTIFGVAGAGAGIPIAIIGSVKARKYCGSARESGDRSYMQLSTKGNGLALNF
jgi:hypothetical protein